ncbi:MAG TPA: hypothetical protein VFU27_09470, partial [Terriglobales bacterium]|nr:hypothetical protein [Terriglobales bacterium]
MEQPTVLVFSADAELARSILARWQMERSVPAFTLVSSRLWNGTSAAFDLAVVGPVTDGGNPALKALDDTGKPVICLCGGAAVALSIREKLPRVLCLQQQEGALDALVVL